MAQRAEAVVAARVPMEIVKELREAAREADCSISGQIRAALRQWSQDRKQAAQAQPQER
jgi:hypothetical protein